MDARAFCVGRLRLRHTCAQHWRACAIDRSSGARDRHAGTLAEFYPSRHHLAHHPAWSRALRASHGATTGAICASISPRVTRSEAKEFTKQLNTLGDIEVGGNCATRSAAGLHLRTDHTWARCVILTQPPFQTKGLTVISSILDLRRGCCSTACTIASQDLWMIGTVSCGPY